MDRFWSKVRETPDGCLTWTGARTTAGYGSFGLRKGLVVYAHRHAWALAHGPIPEGMFVCHRCDNPACLRLNHLFLGAPADNTADMIAKGRAPFGRASAAKTHCPKGHPFDEANTYHYRGKRGCRQYRKAASANSKRATR